MACKQNKPKHYKPILVYLELFNIFIDGLYKQPTFHVF